MCSKTGAHGIVMQEKTSENVIKHDKGWYITEKEMKEYLNNKLEHAAYCDIEMLYGLALGLFGE